MSALGPFLVAACIAAFALAPAPATAQQVSAGTNINMVGGPASLVQGPPFVINGDPYLQRQNEPSIACSSRNPVNCLAAANDYRLVGTPGVQDGKVTGDAWLGVFWSHDEGLTWRSTLLPGFPQDTSAAGTASPISGLGAAADPTVRAGTNGLFYLSGVSFNRANESTSNGGKTGVMFVSLYVDDNNSQGPDSPIRYVRTVVVDNGNSGQFLDKPWIATDIPRSGAGSCTIPGSGGVASQTVPAGNVYVAYSVFLGSGNNPHSKILFTRSTDCGNTWSNPTKINESYSVISQSPAIAVDPTDGTVLVAWRQFGDPNLQDQAQILVAQSSDGGQTFAKTTEVAALGLANPPPPPPPQTPTYTSYAFDQPTLPQFGDPAPTMRMFRTNGFPAVCAGTDGLFRLAWAQRWQTPTSDSRVVVSTSTDGVTWSSPQPVDNYGGRGHQFMPAIACAANQATIAWYDQRFDNAPAVFGQLWFGLMIFDPIPPPPAHTIDVRAAQSNPADASGMTFFASTQVSRYQWALDTTPNPTGPNGINGMVQLEFNPVNWPLYAGGVMPFLGDYIDIAAARVFKAPIGASAGWTYYNTPNETRVLHTAWTDNRDIVNPALNTNWTAWAPPGGAGCTPATVSNRNQNIYTSRLSSGLVVGVEGNSRIVPATGTTVQQRAFVVFVENGTTATRHFHLVTGQAPGGTASFRTDVALGDLLADIAPLSTIARTVFVPASQLSPVVVAVTEVDASGTAVPAGLAGSAVINSDGTAPPPIDGTVATVELHTPTISNPLVNSYANPLYQNPTFINPTFINPTFINPTFINPTFINPTFINPTFINPTFINPTFINPTFINPTFINPTFINQPLTTDVTWQVTNTGNVASGFNFGAILAAVPANAAFQLIIDRLYSTPGSSNCGLGQQYNANIQAVINNPVLQTVSGGNPLAPDVTNATFALAAGDSALVTLRVVHDGSFNPGLAAAQTVSQAANSDLSTSTAQSGPAIGVPFGEVKAEATGPSGALVTFTVTAVTITGVSVPVTCTPGSGTTFGFGPTTVTCTATDPATTRSSSAAFTVRVVDTTPPVLTVPAGVTAPATSAAGALVTFSTSANDTVDGALPVTCVPASGSTFALGATSVSCTATDAHKNTGSANFTVTVNDTTPPVLTAPTAVVAEATGPAGAVVTFTVSALDAVNGPRPVTCLPASGSTFAIGSALVTCSSSDLSGNTATAAFTVNVRDTTPPAITVPGPITAEATSRSGAVVSYAASAVDLVSGVVPVACAPVSGSVFPIGTTTVVCSAKDGLGNTGSVGFTVTVRDTTAPTATVSVNPNTLLWSPNKTMTPVTVSGTAFDATLSTVTYRVVDEYGTIQPSGTVTVAANGSYSFVISLQAWRLGTDASGRLYTIYVTATDGYGHSTTATTTVIVPHN